MHATTNAPYPNRVTLWLDSYIGPFVQDGPLGPFDPRRDIQVYVDGVQQTIQSFAFDAPNNRYLLYLSQQVNLQGVVQVIHHMPSPPFQLQTNPPIFYPSPGDNPDSDSGGA
jgi:hypothetical protein